MSFLNYAINYVFGQDSRIKMEILGLVLLMMSIPLVAASSRSAQPPLTETGSSHVKTSSLEEIAK